MYQAEIAKILKCSLAMARLVEGYMRLENRTLDHLSRAKFRSEAKICLVCVLEDVEAADANAKSFGL